MNRRVFLKQAAAAGLAGIGGIVLAACGGAAGLASSAASSAPAVSGSAPQPSAPASSSAASASVSAPTVPLSASAAPAGSSAAQPAASSAAAAKPSGVVQAATVSVGFLRVVGDSPSVIATNRGYFKEVGLDVNLVAFDGGSKAIPALSAGQLDLTTGTADVNFFNAVGRDIKLRIVGDDGLIAPGHDFYGIAVRNQLVSSGRYKTAKDLKGMKVGVSSLTGALYYFLAVIAQKNGFTPKDYDITTIPFADSIVALKQGGLDAAVLVEPFAGRSETDGNAKVVLRALDVSPDVPGAHLMAAPQFLGRGDVPMRFFTGWLRGVRDYLTDYVNGKNRDQLVKLLQDNKINIVPDAQNPTMDPNGNAPVKPIRDLFDYFSGLGQIQGKVDFDSSFDQTAMGKAAAQLGPYK